MLSQARFVTLCERLGELCVGVCLCGVEGLIGEGEAAEEPHEAFCCRSFFIGLFVLGEELEGGGLRGMSEVPGADFLEGVMGQDKRTDGIPSERTKKGDSEGRHVR